MASKKVFDLLEAEDWNELTELLINTAWTSQDLEEKHGVRSIICISLLKAHYSADMIRSLSGIVLGFYSFVMLNCT